YDENKKNANQRRKSVTIPTVVSTCHKLPFIPIGHEALLPVTGRCQNVWGEMSKTEVPFQGISVTLPQNLIATINK
ncbi:hypothetical protein, partial [Segatella buccae]